MTVPSEEAKVRAVLLVPAEGDPHGLLAEGPCGARPPLAWQRPGIIDVGPWHPGFRYGPSRRALVLAWEGEPVPVGLDRAMRSLGHRPPKQPPTLETVLNWRIPAHLEGWGTLVLLDEQGREVAS